MAQTREHLAILQLTGNPQLTVALTKADRVDDARVGEVREGCRPPYGSMALPMRRFLSPWHRRPRHRLRHHLQQLTSRDHASHHRFRLAIDRAFTVKGRAWWSPVPR
jgi:selenocysteine-specific elongation factor